MNTTNFEIKIRAKDKDAFMNYMKEKDGPPFFDIEKTNGYFDNKRWYEAYYNKDWDDEKFLFCVVGVCYERLAENMLFAAARDLRIPIKILVLYQDPGSGESSGTMFYLVGDMFQINETEKGYIWVKSYLNDPDKSEYYTLKGVESPAFVELYDPVCHGEPVWPRKQEKLAE